MTRPVLTRKDASEEAIQKAFFQWVKLACPKGVICFAVPNGEFRHKATAARLKTLGVMAGVADVVVVLPDISVGFIEFKANKGVPNADQREFRKRCEAIGAPYAICRDSTEAKELVERWAIDARRRAQAPFREAAE